MEETEMTNNQNWILAAGGLAALAVVLVVAATLVMPSQQDINAPAFTGRNGSFTQSKNIQTIGNPVSPGSDGAIFFADDGTGQSRRLLSVSGAVTKAVSPDQASVVLSVETLDASAKTSQSKNAQTTTDVINALKAAGFTDREIKTVGYSLNEEFQWNDITKKSDSTGFRTSNRIQVTLSDITKVGTVIDAATQAGANSVEAVSFSLSNTKETELRTQALGEAAQNARSKAQSIATGLGVSIGSVFSASENSSYATPYYYYNKAYDSRMMGTSEGAPSPQTPISAGDVEFSATVSVQFEIQ
jgi:uncharacterized protein YggE